jgi:hypothetical protein
MNHKQTKVLESTLDRGPEAAQWTNVALAMASALKAT